VDPDVPTTERTLAQICHERKRLSTARFAGTCGISDIRLKTNAKGIRVAISFSVEGKGEWVSDLVHCQKVVEEMLSHGRGLAEVEQYIDDCSLGQMEKAGLWMLAWAHQDQGTQLRLARETLALVSSLTSKNA
jgi:hypothetical protein